MGRETQRLTQDNRGLPIQGAVTKTAPGNDDLALVTRPIMNLDGFGRLRASEPVSLFDSQFQYDEPDIIWREKLTTGGTVTHDAAGSFCKLNTTTTSGSETIRQSPHQRYQPGKSQMILATFDMVEQVANQRKRVGYFDADNGAYLEMDDDGTIYMVLRSKVTGSVVNTGVAQADWSEDAFDGNGPSGITLDLTKSQILAIDLEWLGVGSVRMGFVINGKLYLAHIFNHANSGNKTYMTTANLPVRYEITNTAAPASNGLLRQVCSTVVSEGGFEEGLGFVFAAGNGIITKAATTVQTVPLVSIRPKATFNSIVNRGLIIPENFGFFPQTEPGFMKVIYNGTLTGSPSWVSTHADSIVEYDVTASGITGGITVAHAHADAGGQGIQTFSDRAAGNLSARYPLQLDIDGSNPTNMTIAFTAMANTCNAVGHIGWREIR